MMPRWLPASVWADVMPLIRGVWDAYLEDPHPRVPAETVAAQVAWFFDRSTRGPLYVVDARNIQVFYFTVCRTGVPVEVARLLRRLGQF